MCVYVALLEEPGPFHCQNYIYIDNVNGQLSPSMFLCQLPLPAPVLAQPSSSTEDTCPAQRRWSHWTSSSTARGLTTWRSDTRPPSGRSSNQQQCQSGQPKHLAGGGNQEVKEVEAGRREEEGERGRGT